MNQLQSFIDYERTCKKEVRGGQTYYDIHGHYKYLTLIELFNHWKQNSN